jgi:hypothetical protein
MDYTIAIAGLRDKKQRATFFKPLRGVVNTAYSAIPATPL